MNKEHPKAQIPDNPHAQARYASAKKHAEAAKKAGKSSEEIHALFKRIMSHDAGDIGSIPQDAAHSKYRSAAVHAQKAKAQGNHPSRCTKFLPTSAAVNLQVTNKINSCRPHTTECGACIFLSAFLVWPDRKTKQQLLLS